jgi:hypothetical protein
MLLVGGIFIDHLNTGNYCKKVSATLSLYTHTYDTIVAGDFNTKNKMTTLIAAYNSEQLITSPTHFTEHSSSLINLIFVKYHQNVITSFMKPIPLFLISPVSIVLKLSKPKQNNFKRHIWLYDKGDNDTFRDKLRSSDLQSLLSNDTVDESVDILSNTIIQVASETIPDKEVTMVISLRCITIFVNKSENKPNFTKSQTKQYQFQLAEIKKK